MTTYAVTNELKTYNVRAFAEALTNHRNSFYLMGFQGVAYSGSDTTPDDLVITEGASIDDILNPLFFKKVNFSSANSKVSYVVPDNLNGTLTMYSQRYREVTEANMLTEGVRHLYIEVEIPKDDILVNDVVRGFGLVADLVETGGSIATGDSYLAAEVDLAAGSPTPSNFLLYYENVTKFTRVSTEAGEQFRSVLAF